MCRSMTTRRDSAMSGGLASCRLKRMSSFMFVVVYYLCCRRSREGVENMEMKIRRRFEALVFSSLLGVFFNVYHRNYEIIFKHPLLRCTRRDQMELRDSPRRVPTSDLV